MNRWAWRAALLFAALAAAGPARAQGFFGPRTAMSWAPELDAYWQLGEGTRLQLQVIDQVTPAQQNNQVQVGVLASLRNRLGANWAVDGVSGFYFRWRLRPQLEREVEVGAVALTSLRPARSWNPQVGIILSTYL